MRGLLSAVASSTGGGAFCPLSPALIAVIVATEFLARRGRFTRITYIGVPAALTRATCWRADLASTAPWSLGPTWYHRTQHRKVRRETPRREGAPTRQEDAAGTRRAKHGAQ
eukprot:scaffold647_cov411-Prasinococcus_capsulatus_cf.AAC.6